MIDAVELYGLEALDDPFREEFERARAQLDGPTWIQGLEELETLARAGSMLSTMCVASCMLNGWYDGEDFLGAEAWYRVAADAGYSAAFFGLGLTYYRMGRFSGAWAAHTEAASKGYAPAFNSLGWLYWDGQGAPLDRSTALICWRRGAKLGHRGARINMARALLHGHGGFQGRIEGVGHLFRLFSEIWRDGGQRPLADAGVRPLPTVH